MFNSDKAIISCNDDVLGRKDYAKTVGEAIIKDTNKDSHVIAFYGKWGSGKTSFINMVLEHIENETKGVEDDKKSIIIKFNPWNYSNQDQLINQFFNQLSNSLDKEDNSWLKKSAKLLRTYSRIISPLSLVPGIGAFAFATSAATEIVGEAAEGIGNHLEKDLEGTKDEIIELLNQIEQSIIIVIDDIDRLNEIEIRHIFQLVKSIADFPNMIYVLTFDREIVSKALESEQSGNGGQYLEKIVQIPFELPDFSKLELESFLFSKLDVILQNNPYNDFDKVYWGNIYNSGFKHFFKNIRDINRYINVLNFNYNTIKEEVNVLDFIAITAIQVFLPDVYHGIKNNKHVFAGIISTHDTQREDVDKAICDEVIKRSDDTQTFLQAFLTVLFPRMISIYDNHSHSSGFLVLWRKSRRVCSEDFFDVYFKLSLPKGKVSQAEIKMLLSYGADVVKISELLLQFNEDGKIFNFLDVFTDHIKDMPNECIESFVTAIMDVGDLFPEDDSIFYGTSMRIHWTISSLLEQIDSQEERFNLLKNSIVNTNQSLYTIVSEIDFQDEIHGKYNYDDSDIPIDRKLIDFEHIQSLEQLACEKIELWVENGKLIKSSHLYTILTLWERWENGDKHQECIDSIISSDTALSKLISSMMSKKVSKSINDYLPEITWAINIDALKEITGLDNIKDRVIQIKDSSDYDDLAKNEKDALDVCLEEIEKQ